MIFNTGCGGILKERTGTISTPNESGTYSGDSKCRWIISAPPGYLVQIIWLNFHLEPSHQCIYDYVELFDNNTETGMGGSMGKFCGFTKPPTILTTSNIVTVVFQADSSMNFEGFLASYSFVSQSNGTSESFRITPVFAITVNSFNCGQFIGIRTML